MINMNNTDLAALYKEADLCLERNDLSSALLCYTELCKVDSENAEPWFMLGLVYGETGDLPQAKSCLYRAIELNPAHADAHLNLAHFLSSLDDVESALMHCEQAINHDFEYAEAWLLRSGLLAIQGKLEEALMAVNKALTLNTNLPTALLHAARIEYQYSNRREPICRNSAVDSG